ncbi:hypothetical protein FSARC_2843 [Fusarium sarcochroum]|uniref:Uncharacterized protein n=1 Tax=Fusarium sarcochroum TaxID=1208366 RepID=A0A8H4U540_9HYPO|nr:hypothetical protein FSARC_2843 [Fusarium sarcochroum]
MIELQLPTTTVHSTPEPEPKPKPSRWRSFIASQHDRAGDCPVQKTCSHWKCVWDGQPKQEEGVAELQVLCIPDRFADDAISYYKGTPMLFDDDINITCKPCRLFNALKPDFSGFRDLEGYLVVAWRLVEEEMSDEKWMDQYGRLVAHMG